MTLRLKLTLSMLLAGLFTALVVGVTAWWLVMQDFRKSVEDRAFVNFARDIAAYISQYGSYEAAQNIEPFPIFVFSRRHPDMQVQSPPPSQNSNFGPPFSQQGPSPINGPGQRPGNRGFFPRTQLGPGPQFRDEQAPRPGINSKSSSGIRRHHAPFHFLLLNPQGQVLEPAGDYHRGETVPDDVKNEAKKIVVNGRLAVLAVPIGSPVLSHQDQIYLDSLKRALGLGMIAAALVAIILGVLIGSRLVTRLRELMTGLKRMQPDGEIPAPIEIHSRDEIGQLAETFNHMSQLLMQAHQELRELSLRDPLTGLYNRRYFDEQAHNMFQHAMRYQSPLCVMLADLDHFKLINDSFSHTVGDAVLQRTAEIFQTNIRTSDLIARYGGEEFIAVFAETDFNQAYQRCEQLRQHIETAPWHEVAPGLKVTISIGLCDSVHLGSLEDMIDKADEQLYVAKHKGRNRIAPTTI